MMIPLELAKLTGKLLSGKKWKLVTVESCTGGNIAKLITDIPGSSQWFDGGFITYSNDSKIRIVGVAEELISQNGAVSQKVALAMAKGALDVTNANICISTTGIAGPDGGTIEKPVGTVCFGFATRDNYFSTDKKLFEGNRSEIRRQSSLYSLECLCRFLETGHF